MSTTTVRLTTADLVRLLRPVIPLAAQDKLIPVLNGVWLHTTGHQLVATATDRYRIGVQRITLENRPRYKLAPTVIPLAVVRHVLDTFHGEGRGRSRVEYPVSLGFRDGRLDVAAPSPLGGQIEVRYLLEDLTIPSVRPVLDPPATSGMGPEDELPLDLDLLAGFRPAMRYNRVREARLEVRQGPGRPVLVTIGDHFRGAQMPLTPNPHRTDPAELAAVAQVWDEILEDLA